MPCRPAREKIFGWIAAMEAISNGLSRAANLFTTIGVADILDILIVAAAVLGGGSTALTDALFLSGICSKVTLIHRRDEFRGEAAIAATLREKPNVEFLLSSTVTGLKEESGELSGIIVKDLKKGTERLLPVNGLFIAIGQDPQTEICRGFVETDDKGYITAGEDCITSRKGVFAAGDCRTKAVRQLTTAAGDGAAAGLAACRYVESLSAPVR